MHDLGEQRLAADLFRAHDEGAGLVERAGDHLGARVLANRHGFAGDERLVERRAPLKNRAIDRHFFARPHAQAVANGDRIERHFLVGVIAAKTPRGLWREAKERLDRVGGLFARPEFQHLAKQHENGDDGGGLEIDRDRAVCAPERLRKKARRQCRGGAVSPSDAGAHGDQREHVEITGDERFRTAFEERPACPKHDGRGKDELHPVRCLLRDKHVEIEQVSAHFQSHHRQAKSQRDPESPSHVGKLGIWTRIRARYNRFERHAADRTIAGAGLTDLWMHRAGVDGAFRRWRRRFWLLADIGRGIGGEFGFAPLASRNNRCDGRIRRCAWRCRDRHSFRKPDLFPRCVASPTLPDCACG